MLQRFPMSSVQLLRLETSAVSGPDRRPEPNFWSEPGRGCFWSDPERKIRGTVCNCTIGRLSWGNTVAFLSLFPFQFLSDGYSFLSLDPNKTYNMEIPSSFLPLKTYKTYKMAA